MRPVEYRQRTRPVFIETTFTSPGLMVVTTSTPRFGSMVGEDAISPPTLLRQRIRPFLIEMNLDCRLHLGACGVRAVDRPLERRAPEGHVLGKAFAEVEPHTSRVVPGRGDANGCLLGRRKLDDAVAPCLQPGRELRMGHDDVRPFDRLRRISVDDANARGRRRRRGGRLPRGNRRRGRLSLRRAPVAGATGQEERSSAKRQHGENWAKFDHPQSWWPG